MANPQDGRKDEDTVTKLLADVFPNARIYEVVTPDQQATPDDGHGDEAQDDEPTQEVEASRSNLNFSSNSNIVGNQQTFELKRYYDDNNKAESLTLLLTIEVPDNAPRRLTKLVTEYESRITFAKGQIDEKVLSIEAKATWRAKKSNTITHYEQNYNSQSSKTFEGEVDIEAFDPHAVDAALRTIGSGVDLMNFLARYLPRQFMLARPKWC